MGGGRTERHDSLHLGDPGAPSKDARGAIVMDSENVVDHIIIGTGPSAVAAAMAFRCSGMTFEVVDRRAETGLPGRWSATRRGSGPGRRRGRGPRGPREHEGGAVDRAAELPRMFRGVNKKYLY